MKRETYTLPSGAKVELRQIKLAEENALAEGMGSSTGEAQQQQVLSDVLTACTERVIDPGPYQFLTQGAKPDWKRMLSGDRIATMILLRVLSYRDREQYTIGDIKCPACGKRRDYVINLFEDLFWRGLDDEAREHLAQGSPFELLIGEARVLYTMGTGETQALANALADQYPDRAVSAGMRSRILDVYLHEGDEEPIPRSRIMDWLDGTGDTYEGLTSDEADEIRDAFEEAECGVDTDVDLKCPAVSCRHEFVVQLPFDGMFAPRTGARRHKRGRHRGQAYSAV
jgi:hypothetical protein